MNSYKIAVIVGSLRKESYNLKTAKALMGMVPETLSFELLPIGDLPLYNEEYDGASPEQYNRFREQLRSFDGFLFLTPEYNRSVPGVLKNAIDVGSRPYGQNCWDGKPGAIVSVSISSLGGFGANHHLRQSLVFINVPAMPQPEAYIGNAQNLFDESGNLTNQSTREFLQTFMTAFENWVKVHAKQPVPA
jgi:chromate reductase, NAD(P)H dehydrogenase (quinone)